MRMRMTERDGEAEGEMRREIAKEEVWSFGTIKLVCSFHDKHTSRVTPKYLYEEAGARTLSQRRVCVCVCVDQKRFLLSKTDPRDTMKRCTLKEGRKNDHFKTISEKK